MSPSGRLLAAAALLLVGLGFGWGGTAGQTGYLSPGFVLPTGYVSPITGEYSPGTGIFIPGTYVPGYQDGIKGYESDVRIVLVPAAAMLWAASRRRTELTRRLARVATGLSVVLLVLALSRGMSASALLMAAVLALAAPVTVPDLLARLRGRLAGS